MTLRRSLFSALGVSLVAGSAFAIGIPIHSFLMFPRPLSKVTSFTSSELAQYGIEAEGFNIASTAVSGNLRAPIDSTCVVFSNSESEFTFDVPRSYVGISVADADYGVDEGAQIVMAGFDVEGNLVAGVQSFLHPSNSLNEQNRSAVFLGAWSSTPIARILIRSSVEQATIVDNLVFEEIP